MKSIAMCVALLLLAGVAIGEEKQPDPQSLEIGCSGMIRLTDAGDTADYLVVHDRKDHKGHAPFAWLGIMTWTKDQAPTWRSLWLDVPEGEDPPSDLEALCAVPGTTDLFLAAESGYWKDPKTGEVRYGRIFLFRITKPSDKWQLEWERSFRPYPVPTDSTPRQNQIEGMACVATGEESLALLLATVGKKGFASLLHWGALDLDAEKDENVYDERGCAVLTGGSGPLCGRSCGAMRLRPPQPDGDLPVWSAATVEEERDMGPFRSQVFEAGRLRRVRNPTLFQYCRYRRPLLVGNLEHLKIEALALPPSWAKKALLVYGTDDEDYGGVYRPLFPRR